jgi:hypothetical protein
MVWAKTIALNEESGQLCHILFEVPSHSELYDFHITFAPAVMEYKTLTNELNSASASPSMTKQSHSSIVVCSHHRL